MQKPQNSVTFILGLLLFLVSLFLFISSHHFPLFIPLLIGLSLIYIGIYPGRISLLVFGHILVVVGCFLLTWGIYLLPHSKPLFVHIVGRPLFWGLISIFGGICTIYHGFCRCISSNAKSSYSK